MIRGFRNAFVCCFTWLFSHFCPICFRFIIFMLGSVFMVFSGFNKCPTRKRNQKGRNMKKGKKLDFSPCIFQRDATSGRNNCYKPQQHECPSPIHIYLPNSYYGCPQLLLRAVENRRVFPVLLFFLGSPIAVLGSLLFLIQDIFFLMSTEGD